MALEEEHCKPCKSGDGNLTPDESRQLLRELNGWTEEGPFLFKRWKFKNFLRALAFVNAVGQLAEAQQHHPDISLGWGYAEIRLTTHAVGGLSRNDFILAARIDANAVEA